jgi:hypothetical protein
MFSLTQGGNVAQFIGMLLTLTGMSKEEAEAGAVTLQAAFGILVYVGGFLAAWIGRWRKGDITLAGFRK